MEPDKWSLEKEMVFQDPPVSFHVSWWEGKRFGNEWMVMSSTSLVIPSLTSVSLHSLRDSMVSLLAEEGFRREPTHPSSFHSGCREGVRVTGKADGSPAILH